jgi:hypothetical protein
MSRSSHEGECGDFAGSTAKLDVILSLERRSNRPERSIREFGRYAQLGWTCLLISFRGDPGAVGGSRQLTSCPEDSSDGRDFEVE